MKIQIKTYFLGILILLFSFSCSQVVKETVSPVTPRPVSGQFKKIVILPFADYTPASSPYGYLRRNVLVLEALQDEFFQAGFVSEVEEDVTGYLTSEGIIKPCYDVSVETALLQEELENEDWTEKMRREFEKIIFQNKMATNKARKLPPDNQKFIALDSQRLMDLGNTFGADYIVRGRIIEFRSGQEDTFNPIKIGLLPFVIKSSQRTIFGVAKSDTYETIDKVAIGGVLGGIYGNSAESPYTIADYTNYNHYNALVWGAVGAGAGYLADKAGKVPRATVQLRVMVQDARTGEIIWLNRAEASTVPFSTYAEHDSDLLFAKSIRQAARSLVDNFVASLITGRVVRIDKQGMTVAPKVSGESKAQPDRSEGAIAEARKAAYDAEESAQKAREAAIQAQKASGEAKKAKERAKEASAKTQKVFEKIVAK